MSFKKELHSRLDSWVEKGIIMDNQKLLIIEDVEEETSTSMFFTILSVIGALFIGGGILLIISSNWEHIPKFLKLIMILSMPIISMRGGYYLSYINKEYKKIGDSLIFLGNILIGASLALLSQLYHTSTSISVIIILWLILMIPFVFIFKYKALAALNISLLYLIIYSFFEDHHWYWINEDRLLLVFFITSLSITLITSFLEKINSNFFIVNSSIISVYKVVSAKILMGTLFIGILWDDFYFLGEHSGILQHILFLVTVFIIMWDANRTYNIILRHSTFFWLGLFMIVKYFDIFGSYMNSGLAFVGFGVFLIGLVYGYIKVVKYFKNS